MTVVDASVIVDWIAPGVPPASPTVALREAWVGGDIKLIAPWLMELEVRNALLTGIRRGRWDGSDADRAETLLAELPVRIEDGAADVARAWDLSRRYDAHPVYDMIYVALAERREVPFVTADARLRNRLAGLEWVLAPEDALP